MKEIELYDIITLEDNTEYTVVKSTLYQGNKYYLIAPIDENEDPNMNLIKIVKELKDNALISIIEETDETKIKELSKIFLDNLTEY